jgi:hypothetical protein
VLYFNTSNGQHIVILEPENLEALKTGQFAVSSNKAVMIAYTSLLKGKGLVMWGGFWTRCHGAAWCPT